ncbi:MAG TPA: hypothetical protein ENJ51_01740 [Leucothrix mucor]|uniref:DUF945 domain-containing protein n=1 Tax=Leucothrix mucor TaxID=45248 RepID=A0A7V2SY13_LEUMU|nr:hypothetical protein [Leucothrix mucor]
MTTRFNTILLGIAIVFLSLIMIWGLAGWYLTKDAQQQLSDFLQENVQNNALNSIDAELLSYKTTLVGAKASLKISSKIAFIDEQMGELFLNANLFFGPVFIDDGKLRFGKVLWKISLDPLLAAQQLSESSQTQIGEIFKSNSPFLSLWVDFDNTLHYHSHIRTLATASLRADHIISDGVLSADSLHNKMQIHADNLSLIATTGLLEIPRLIIDVDINKQKQRQQKLIHYTTKPFKLTLSGMSGTVSKPIFIAKGNLAHINQFLSGKLQLITPQTKQLELIITLRDVSTRGYQQFLQAEAQAFNLKQQIQWTLEENAETPEGQDHIWLLNDKIDQQRGQLTKIVAQKMLSKKTSLINISLDTTKEATILPEFMYQKLLRYSQRGMLNKIENHYQMVITSANNKLLVNHNSMTWGDFLQALATERN